MEPQKGMYRQLYKNICSCLEKEPPAGNILWPLDVTEEAAEGFGYVTEDCSPNYLPFEDYLEGRAFFSGWSMIVNAALSLTALFLRLKEKGCHFVDLSNGDVLVHSQNGKVLLAGAEMLTWESSVNAAGAGTLMSPEYITGKRAADERTDEYLLAVLLFELFFRGHPLEGLGTARNPVMTKEIKESCYGTAPVFVYDPEDESNRPVRGIHINVPGLWKQCPKFLQRAFEEGFDKRVLAGKRRGISAEQWYKNLILLRSVIVPCSCGMDNFLPVYMGEEKGRCVRCRSEIENPSLCWKPGRQRITSYPVVPGGVIYRCQLETNPGTDFNAEAGRFIRNKDSGLCLIQNTSDTPWIIPETGEQVEAGETIPAREGLVVSIEDRRMRFEAVEKKENEV